MSNVRRNVSSAMMLLAMTACTAPSPVIPAQPSPSLDAVLLTPTAATEQTAKAASGGAELATPVPAKSLVPGATKASASAAEPSEHLGAQAPTSAAEPSAEPLAQPAARMKATQYLDIAPDDDRAQYALIGREMITSTAPTAVPIGAPFYAAALVDLNRYAATGACIAEQVESTGLAAWHSLDIFGRNTFEPGEVTLGANWMPPASGVRSHYLLFVK